MNQRHNHIAHQLLAGNVAKSAALFGELLESRKRELAESITQTLTEIKWRSTEVVNSALDAAIYCGFEAETVWDDEVMGGGMLTADYVDQMSFDDVEVQDFIREQRGNKVIQEIYNDYMDALTDSPAYNDAFSQTFDGMRSSIIDDDDRLEEFLKDTDAAETYAEDIDGYRQKHIDYLQDQRTRRLQQQDTEAELLQDPDLRSNADHVARQKARVERITQVIAALDRELVKYQSDDTDQQALLREYFRDEHTDGASEFFDWANEVVEREHEDDVREEAWQDAQEEYPIDLWIEHQDRTLSRFLRTYDIYVADSDGYIDQIGEMVYDGWISSNSDFSEYLAGEYETTGDDPTIWHIETDSSIQGGLGAEIVSPVYETPRQMLAEMFSLFDWLQGEGAKSNQSTGLHVTMSMPGEQSEVNAVKMAVMLDDVYLLRQFARLGNTYTQSQLELLKDQAQSAATGSERSIEELEKMLEAGISREKFRSIHLKGSRNDEGNQLIEFRIAGGGDYLGDRDKVQDAVVRYATTMQLGYDSDAYRREYATKLVRMLNKSLDLDIGEQPAGTDNTLQILTQAVKELNITNSFVKNAIVRKLKWLNTHMPTMPDQSDREKLELYKDNVREIIYWMAEAVSEGQTKDDPTARIARMLRTVLNTAGIGIVELAGGMQKAYMTSEERISALAKLLAAPKLLDKFGLEKIRRIIKLKPGGTLLVLGSAINHVLAGEYDQIDPNADFATIDESLQTYLRRLGWNNTSITDTNSEQYQNNVLPVIEDLVEDYLRELQGRLGAPVWAKHSVRPETGDVETDLTADLTKPVEANQWYVINSDHSYMISKFRKAGISFR